jgi:4-amino-4-deoxy-L-arabinose transferase-like glycosyltransferase
MGTSKISAASSNIFLFQRVASPVWGILALGAILRLLQIGTESVWADEMYSMDDALNFGQDGIGVRPFYYLLLRVWMVGGTGDVWLRSLSILLDIGAIFLAYRLCEYALGKTAAWITALIMSLSPLMVNHAQEIRMYPLITFLTLLGSLTLIHTLEHPNGLRFAVWAVSRLLALLTSPLMALMVLTDCLLYGLNYWRNWSRLKAFVYGLAFIGAAWAPIFLSKLLAASDDFAATHSSWDPDDGGFSITSVVSRLTTFTVYWPLQSLEYFPSSIPINFYKLFTVLLVAILFVAVAQLRLNVKLPLLWIAAWALVPATVQLVASETVMSGTIWRERYLLYLAPYFIMLMVHGFQRIWRWQPKIGGLIAVLYFIAVAGGLVQYYAVDYRPEWQAVADTVEANDQASDVFVNYTWMGEHNLPRYYDGDAELVTIHLPRRFPTAERLELVKETANDLPQAERLWLACQLGCAEQEEFGIIQEAVVGENAEESFYETFKNIGDEIRGFGEIELYLLTAD